MSFFKCIYFWTDSDSDSNSNCARTWKHRPKFGANVGPFIYRAIINIEIKPSLSHDNYGNRQYHNKKCNNNALVPPSYLPNVTKTYKNVNTVQKIQPALQKHGLLLWLWMCGKSPLTCFAHWRCLDTRIYSYKRIKAAILIWFCRPLHWPLLLSPPIMELLCVCLTLPAFTRTSDLPTSGQAVILTWAKRKDHQRKKSSG